MHAEYTYIINLLTNRTKSNYDILKNVVFDYLNNITNFNTSVTKRLKDEGKQVNSLRIVIKDINQTLVIDTYETASNTYEDFINYTIFSKNYCVSNDLQHIESLKSYIYDGHGEMNYCHVQQTNVNGYDESHKFNYNPLYNLNIIYTTKDNIRVVNNIAKSIPEVYPLIDTRLKMIHNELNNELSDLINILTEDRTEDNYNNLKNAVFDYLDRIKKCNTPITNELQSLKKQINSPRIVIFDCNCSFIIDTYETSSNSLDNYLTNTIHKSTITHRSFLEINYALLYGHYGGTKHSYIIQQDINYYVQSHGLNLSQPIYYIYISCLSDENNMINNNIIKLELVKDIPLFDFRLKMIHDEYILQINYLLDIFVNEKTEDNYNNLKIITFNYLENIINCSTPVTKQFKYNNKQINSPNLMIHDSSHYIVLDTFETCNNTYSNFLNNQIYKYNNPLHILLPDYIRCAFYGSHSGTKYSYYIQKNYNFYHQSYGPNLSESSYYINIFCLADENI
jgi:hypothetical protein